MIKASQRAIDLWAYRHLAGYVIDDVPVTRLSDTIGPTLYLPLRQDNDLFAADFTPGDTIYIGVNTAVKSVKVTLYQKERNPGEWVQCLVAWDDEYGLFLSPVVPANIQAWIGTSYTFATQQQQETNLLT